MIVASAGNKLIKTKNIKMSILVSRSYLIVMVTASLNV